MSLAYIFFLRLSFYTHTHFSRPPASYYEAKNTPKYGIYPLASCFHSFLTLSLCLDAFLFPTSPYSHLFWTTQQPSTLSSSPLQLLLSSLPLSSLPLNQPSSRHSCFLMFLKYIMYHIMAIYLSFSPLGRLKLCRQGLTCSFVSSNSSEPGTLKFQTEQIGSFFRNRFLEVLVFLISLSYTFPTY